MKINVLIENTSDGKYVCEHGLSFLIEYGDKKILLDAGTTEEFYNNALKMGILLNDISFCVLSHGHYDHSGGFGVLLKANKDLKVYMQDTATETYYSGNGGMHEIGIPKNVLEYNKQFVKTDGLFEICEGVKLVPHSTDNLCLIGEKAKLYKLSDGKIVPDDFCHEQSLVFDTEKGLVIFNSCSHGGVANIIREVKQACDNKKIYAYVGGLHMKGKIGEKEICTFTDEEVDKLCNVIKSEEIEAVYTGHCTGLVGYEKINERIGNVLHRLTSGMIFEL